jgi:hypothetical protein
MLHITDGESVAGTLRGSAIQGTVAIYGDLMYEGPAPAGLWSFYIFELDCFILPLAESGFPGIK